MSFNYKDLTYIRAALETYEGLLSETTEEECEENEFSEVQDDILYVSRLIALTNEEIKEWEEKGPSLTPVDE